MQKSNLKYADRVVVTEGFYEGLVGIVEEEYEEKHLFYPSSYYYLVDFLDCTITLPESSLKLVERN